MAAHVSEAPVKVLMTVEEAAESLSLSRTVVYALMKQGLIFSVKVGTARRVPVKALYEFVQRLVEQAGN